MCLRKVFLFIFLLLIIAALAGCENKDSVTQPYAQDLFGYTISETFTPLVNALGELQSPAITDIFVRNGVYYQYTLAYLMVYNPSATVGLQYRLFPLGNDLRIAQPPAQISQGNDLVVDGYVIWSELEQIYRIYGTSLIGPPITELLYNKDMNRYEQYFTNMAFYRNVDGREGEIGLMPYGAWYCNSICEQAYESIYEEFIPLPPVGRELSGKEQQAELTIDNFARKLGSDFTGEPLSGMQSNADGQYFRIYENVVMIVDPSYVNEVKFLDLPEEVGVAPNDPEPPQEASDYVFFPVRANLGFNIPKAFFDFITLHGTFEVSGPPIQNVQELDNSGIVQCFEHLCLEFRPNTLSSSKVRLLPLGRDYFRKITGMVPAISGTDNIPQTLNVKVWERYPLLPPNQSQEIGVAVFEGNQPLSNVNFYVTLLLPNGSQVVNFLNATGSDGQTHIVLDPIDLPKGTMVPYQVCVAGAAGSSVCLNESFLIWEDE